MAILELIASDNPTLRQTGRPVTSFGAEFQTLVDDMIETMRAANGVGLAAPQIDLSLQLAVIESLPTFDDDGVPVEGSRKLFVIANPEITWESKKRVVDIEGCLSIPGWLGEVERAHAIRVQGRGRFGQKLNLRLKGWTARIFQHEIDHLNGVLFTDRLTAPENFWTEGDYEKMMAERDKNEI